MYLPQTCIAELTCMRVHTQLFAKEHRHRATFNAVMAVWEGLAAAAESATGTWQWMGLILCGFSIMFLWWTWYFLKLERQALSIEQRMGQLIRQAEEGSEFTAETMEQLIVNINQVLKK